MAAEISPPELARLVDYAERPRTGDWSLRAALVRYAQSEAQRVGDLLELVRRIEFALRPHLKAVERAGAAVWQALESSDGEARADGDSPVEPVALGLLEAMVELDRLGDLLAEWAAAPDAVDRPDDAVDAVTAEVTGRVEALGVPREQRQRPTRRRA